MRALWSDRPNCSHNVSQKVKRIRRLSDSTSGPKQDGADRLSESPGGGVFLRLRARSLKTNGR